MIPSRVEKILNKYKISPDDRILVAVSGGADSMTLLQVLSGLGYNCQAAHCNFHLRDKESDDDERFLFDYCLGNDIPGYRFAWVKRYAGMPGSLNQTIACLSANRN
jgi:tRNA(Ile)-lysidine synthase